MNDNARYILFLINDSIYDDDWKQFYIDHLDVDIDNEDAQEWINHFNDNRKDHIGAGENYNMGDIQRKLRNECG